MKTYKESDLPSHTSIADQTDNFLMVRFNLGTVWASDLETFLSLNLQPCGISPGSNGHESIVAFLKMGKNSIERIQNGFAAAYAEGQSCGS